MWNNEWYLINKKRIVKVDQRVWKSRKILEAKSIDELKRKYTEDKIQMLINDVRRVRAELRKTNTQEDPRRLFIKQKKIVKEIVMKDKVETRGKEYSVRGAEAAEIRKYIQLGNQANKWNLEEGGFGEGFRKVNIIAYGRGYVFIEHFCYLYWTKRRNKFVLGFTDEGRVFLKELPTNIPDAMIKWILYSENPKLELYITLTGEQNLKNAIIQGDIVLKPIKLTKKKKLTFEKVNEVKIRTHRLIGEEIYQADNYVILKKPAYLIHREHNHITIPEGTYKILKQKTYALWDFSEKPRD